MSKFKNATDIHSLIKKKYADVIIRSDYGEILLPDDPDVLELEALIKDSKTPWAHYSQGKRELETGIADQPDKFYEANPGTADPLLHIGSPRAAEERYEHTDAFMTALENRARRGLGREELPEGPARTIPIELRNINNIAWVNDNGLITPNDHLMAAGKVPYGTNKIEEHPLAFDPIYRNPLPGATEKPPLGVAGYKSSSGYPNGAFNTGDPQFLENNPKAKENVVEAYKNAGYDALAYRNDVEDEGSISIVPLGMNKIYNALTGERIKQIAGSAGVGGLLAAGGSNKAHAGPIEQGVEDLRDEFREDEARAREPFGGSLYNQLKFKAAAEIMKYRGKVNKDVQEDPIRAAASIPAGAGMGIWELSNMIGHGYNKLDKFVNQHEDPTTLDSLLEQSDKAFTSTEEYLQNELGLSPEVMLLGEFTGAGGLAPKVANKASKKALDVLNWGWNL